MQMLALIVDSFRHARDRKLFWVMIGISTLIAVVMACIGMDASGTTILFKWEFPGEVGRAMAAAILVHYIAGIYIGWIGIILALIATAGIFPAFMERGSVDVVLAKPLSRPMLFLGKYAGSMAFVLVQAVYFIGLTFLVVGLRWHYWIWSYFWLIPLLVLVFSYLYAFCALFGVMTRSGLASLLLTILAWFAIWILQTAYSTLVALNAMDAGPNQKGPLVSDKWVRVAEVVRVAVPNTQDIPMIAAKLMEAASSAAFMPEFDNPNMSEQEREQMRAQMDASMAATLELEDVNIVRSIGSSLLFEVAIVLLAMWKFTRRDF